jgi:hypothetical protein
MRTQLMKPLDVIRKYCLMCAGSSLEVHNCGGDQLLGQKTNKRQCFFYRYRNGTGKPNAGIIKKHCLQCMGGSWKLVEECVSVKCPVFDFRFGRYPQKNVIKMKTQKSGSNLKDLRVDDDQHRIQQNDPILNRKSK